MRIGLVSLQASPLAVGGADERHRHVGELAAALTRGGHEVRVYTCGSDTDGRYRAAVVVEHGPEPSDAWLGERWGRWRPDVVHSHFWRSGPAAVAAAREQRIPVVHTYHSLGAARRRWYGRADPAARDRIRQERAIKPFVHRVVALCHSEVSELIRMGVPRDAITVVPSGVDTELFTPKGEMAPTQSGRPRILAVGQASGFDEMINALRWVPAAELVIAGGPEPDRLGSDPGMCELRALADAIGVADRVRLVGAVPVDGMPAWYRSAQIFASTTSGTTFGLPAVEAMACGVPVVAYASGGFPESVVHRVTGLLVQPHDVRGLAVTLRRLLGSELDRLAYGDAGVDRATVRYDWRRIVVDLERVYDSVLGLPPRSGGTSG